MRPFAFCILLALAAATATLPACGNDSDDDASGGPSGTGTGISEATITITAAGVSPSAVTITSGNHVTFVNNDTVQHTMSSNPHPVHTDCPALNHGTLLPGQSRATGNLTARRTCGFHDHDNPDTPSLQGSVTVQ
jgi:plastocyanin